MSDSGNIIPRRVHAINQRAAAVFPALKVVAVVQGKPPARVSCKRFTQGSSWQVEERRAREGQSGRTLQGVVGNSGAMLNREPILQARVVIALYLTFLILIAVPFSPSKEADVVISH